jgi:dolichyl-phosphate beta-glucosyltransferase
VIPAYNEEARLVETLERIAGWLQICGGRGEIIVVDDGSTDATAEKTVAFARSTEVVRLLRCGSNRGKGYAVRTGVLAARCEAILVTDADLSTPIEEAAKLFAALESADVVIGSRSTCDAELYRRQGWLREFCGKSFNRIIRRLGLTRFGDTQCGFKLWRAEAGRQVFSACRIDGYAFDVEALLLANRFGLRVREVGIVWRNSPQSKVRIVVDSLAMLGEVAKIRWRLSAGQYPTRAP